MGKTFYPKLALQNIEKNARNYISYMITCIITIMMFYIMCALANASELRQIYGLSEIQSFLAFGQWIIGIFALIFLFYTHSFITKRRKKEFGLYNILGMEKKHISIILLFETLYCSLISLGLGLLLGIILYRAAQLFLMKLAKTQAALGSPFSGIAISTTLILFGIIFFLTFLSTLRQIRMSSPIELLRGSQVGEKEPKARIILASLGVICLGLGYYISITATSPMETVGLFFVAVILVIVGTYLLFTAVTIAVLKLLRKNKHYYYKPNHFTFISGMLYRMKQNAIGLANICVLSTMVLVMMSVCLLLYVGIEDSIRTAYPRNIEINIHRMTPDEIDDAEHYIDTVLEQNHIVPKNLQRFSQASLTLIQENTHFYYSDQSSIYTDSNTSVLTLMTLQDFNRIAGTDYTLDTPKDIYLCTYNEGYKADTLMLEDTVFNIKGIVDDVEIADGPTKDLVSTFYMIVKDQSTLSQLLSDLEKKEIYTLPTYYYTFDVDADDDKQLEIWDILLSALFQSDSFSPGTGGSLSCSAEATASYYQLYGGLLFIGIFLGILFLMATVLIIYYKQITEGYEDQARFEIMQNVGMSMREVKSTIKSQVLSVFYLPLGLACVHTAFAFPIISRLLKMLQMTNIPLFLWGMAATIAIFAIFYTVIYVLTARVYYKIVSAKNRKRNH